LATDQKEGVFWITRLKLGTTMYGSEGQRLELASWLSDSQASSLDLQVSLGEQHRLTCRLIAVRVSLELADRRRQVLHEWAQKKQKPISAQRLKLAEWIVVVTNVPEDRLSAHEVLTMLRVRWQVDLALAIPDPDQLLATLMALCNCPMASCRQQKRKTDAATFQEFLSLR
jgi:hypothetical protein